MSAGLKPKRTGPPDRGDPVSPIGTRAFCLRVPIKTQNSARDGLIRRIFSSFGYSIIIALTTRHGHRIVIVPSNREDNAMRTMLRNFAAVGLFAVAAMSPTAVSAQSGWGAWYFNDGAGTCGWVSCGPNGCSVISSFPCPREVSGD
jgi:hypothetical protein